MHSTTINNHRMHKNQLDKFLRAPNILFKGLFLFDNLLSQKHIL